MALTHVIIILKECKPHSIRQEILATLKSAGYEYNEVQIQLPEEWK